MKLDGIVSERIAAHMGIPSHDLTPEMARSIVLAKHLNIVHLVHGSSVITFPDGIDPDSDSSKMARAINIILLDHFDSIQEMYDTLAIDSAYIRDIWETELRQPKLKQVKRLIEIWDIDPLFLYGSKTEAFINQGKRQTA